MFLVRIYLEDGSFDKVKARLAAGIKTRSYTQISHPRQLQFIQFLRCWD
jgi:hypothetical protein